MGQEVEEAEQQQDIDGGATRGVAIRIGVVANEDVRQAHRAQAQRDEGRVDPVGRVVTPARGVRATSHDVLGTSGRGDRHGPRER